MSYNIGDRVRIMPETFGAGVNRPGEKQSHANLDKRANVHPLPGTVTFINRRWRWYQVTFW